MGCSYNDYFPWRLNWGLNLKWSTSLKVRQKLQELQENLDFIHRKWQITILLFFLSPSQIIMSVVISNVTLVDNGLGIMSLIYAPPSLSHAYADKTVHIQVQIHSFQVFSFPLVLIITCSIIQLYRSWLFFKNFYFSCSFCPRMPWLLAAAPTSTVRTLCPPVTLIFSSAMAIEPRDLSTVRCKRHDVDWFLVIFMV